MSLNGRGFLLTCHVFVGFFQENPDLKADAENVCVDQKLENVIINVTFIQTMDVKEYTWCLQVPPR